jgi:hypothetical protein
VAEIKPIQEGWEQSWNTVATRPWGLIGVLVVLVGLGLLAFVAGLLSHPQRAWQSYLVNFLFWGGLAQGAVVFAAVYRVVGGKWGPTVRRLAEGMALFIPVSFLLFFPLY